MDETGISFGLTSAVFTSLDLMIGLHSGTHSKIVVLAGILTIAIADAFSDAMGIHVSEEADHTNTAKQIWGDLLSKEKVNLASVTKTLFLENRVTGCSSQIQKKILTNPLLFTG